jgi:dimethylamine/trimethylamine dehydrogenase
MEGFIPRGRIVIYDDDHYYMGGVLAELLARNGARVMIVTPSSMVGNFSQLTLEQKFMQRRLLEMGVQLKLTHGLGEIARDHVKLACIYTGKADMVEMDGVVLVTARLPEESLSLALKERALEWRDHGIRSITAIGDCLAPGTIAHAVYSGHRYARLLDATTDPDAVAFRREVTQLSPAFPARFP